MIYKMHFTDECQKRLEHEVQKNWEPESTRACGYLLEFSKMICGWE